MFSHRETLHTLKGSAAFIGKRNKCYFVKKSEEEGSIQNGRVDERISLSPSRWDGYPFYSYRIPAPNTHALFFHLTSYQIRNNFSWRCASPTHTNSNLFSILSLQKGFWNCSVNPSSVTLRKYFILTLNHYKQW